MTNANIHRYRVRLIIDRDPRCCWIGIPIRQNNDPPLLWFRHRQVATRGLQAHEELAKDADGVLCTRRQGSRHGWPTCSRAEWARRIGRRGRDERVRNLQRWCVGRSKRYVSAFLCFSLLPQLPRIALHFSHTIGEALEPKKATPRHRRGRRVSPIALDRRRAVSNICQLIYQHSSRKTRKKRPGLKRCVRPAVGITSASHRNTARACVSLHPRQGLPPPGTVPPSVLFRTQAKLPSNGALHRRCQHAFCLRLHDIGATRPSGFAAVRLCAQKILAGPFSCGASLLFVFVVNLRHSWLCIFFEYIADFVSICRQ